VNSAIEQRRRLVTELPGPRSRALQERKVAAVSAGVPTGLPAYIVESGQDGILVDADGNQLIDFGSGIAVTSVGNGNQRVVDAVQEQIARLTHTCVMVTPYEPYVEVCEKLNALTPGDHDKRSALFNSGAEAVENAVKIARHFTGRQAIVAFDHAYHGRTNLTLGMTAKNMPYKDRFGPFAGELYRVPMAYPYRWPGGEKACESDAFDSITDQVHAQVGEHNTAAVIIEPIQGEGGFIVPPAGFLKELAQWCADHDILFIADEVQSGFCRTGDWFACDHEGVVPDLITTAKGIAGGMPLAAVTGSRRHHGLHPPRRSRRDLWRQPRGLRRGARLDRDDGGRWSGRACPRDRGDPQGSPDRARGAFPAGRRGTWPRRDDRDGVGGGPRDQGACCCPHGGGQQGLPRARGLVTLTCGTLGNVFRFLPP
jgi:4-aminobutyrate aminotransferase/(S)-3-amino-2-methylpropionate transaminase